VELGTAFTPTFLDYEHRPVAANDRKKGISGPFGILVRDIEAKLIAIKGDGGCCVAHNEKWCDAV
jgi:hypothetical protein